MIVQFLNNLFTCSLDTVSGLCEAEQLYTTLLFTDYIYLFPLPEHEFLNGKFLCKRARDLAAALRAHNNPVVVEAPKEPEPKVSVVLVRIQSGESFANSFADAHVNIHELFAKL